LYNQAEVMPRREWGTQRDCAYRATRFDIYQNILAVIIAVDIDLEHLKNRQILFDELLG
jgi:hypothetical protein